MRNWLSILLLSTTLWLTNACTHETIEVQDRDGISSLSTLFNSQGDAYLRFDIALPSAATHSRAGTFEDGNADEYRVDWTHSYLFLFAGDGTPDGTHIASCYRLDNANHTLTGTTSSQITSEYQLLQTITRSGIREGDHLYAYVLLNAGEQLLTATFTDQTIRQLTLHAWNGNTTAALTLFDGSGTTPAGMSLRDFLDLKIYFPSVSSDFPDDSGHPFLYSREGQTYFTMTNAWMAVRPGGILTTRTADTPYLLASIDPDRLYPRREDALSSQPAAYIYVERAVAKVDLTVADSPAYGSLGVDDAGHPLQIIPQRWTLLNAGRLSYLTKHIDDYSTWSLYTSNATTGNYRFVEAEPAALLPAGYTYAPTSYRISWAESPTYSADKGENDLFPGSTHTDLPDALTYPVGTTVAAYPMENTFDVGRMTYQNTTGVVVKARAKATDATTDAEITDYGILVLHHTNEPDRLLTLQRLRLTLLLWIRNDNNLLRLSEALATEGSIYSTAHTEWKNKWFDLLNRLLTTPEKSAFYALRTVSADPLTFRDLNRNSANASYFHSQAVDETMLTGLRTTNLPDTIRGLYNCKNGCIGVGVHDYPDDLPIVRILRAYIDASISYLEEPHSNLPTFGFYRKGVMYYRSLIRHFSDTETPWNGAETPQPVNLTYPETHAESNYLGRYGVVRNHWYHLQINSFRNPGDIRVLPFNTSDPDDRLEQYMRLQMYVLPWTLRENHFFVGNPYDSYNPTQP